jgi:hypothetical protein
MLRATGLFSIALLSVATLSAADPAPAPGPKPPPTPAPAEPQSLIDRAKMLEPIQVESLTLTPMVSTDKLVAADDDLLVLDETMPKKLVKIVEFDEGNVNSLTISNKADHPVFLLAGEVIIGGKQDRIIGRNTIIPAKKIQEVPVFCVEHGRWEAETKEFASAKALAHGRLRGRASFDSQQAVWDEVAAKNVARKTESSTDTYRKVASEQSDGSLTGKWEHRVDDALAKIAPDDRARIVGFAVAVNGKVATVDMFQSPALFKKLESKLVRSYITDAIDVATNKAAKQPTAADVKAFVADAEKAKSEASYATDDGDTSIKKGDHAAKARVMYKKAGVSPSAAAPPAAAVYETYQAR